MTDARIVTLALVFIAALGAILYNNSRITDLRTDINARSTEWRADTNARNSELRADTNARNSELRADMNALNAELRADMNRRFDDVNRHIDDKFALVIERLERMEDTFTRLLGDHETRLHKLEHPEA